MTIVLAKFGDCPQPIGVGFLVRVGQKRLHQPWRQTGCDETGNNCDVQHLEVCFWCLAF